jgi:hypothetical protein
MENLTVAISQTDLNQVKPAPETPQAQPETTRATFSEEVYSNLPEALQTTCNKLQGTDKEVYFVGSLAALSAILPNLQASYDGSRIEANLYLFLLGAFGSGKGSLKYAQKLVEPVHEYLRSQEQPTEAGLPSTKKLLFLPANSSKSGLIELLATLQRGLIFETESDVLADQIRQDYGNFSDLLRTCFHHETARFYRRLQKEYYEIDSPKLSVLLSGTPGQLRKLIPGIENGLFSRFMFFEIEPELTFKNVFSTNGSDLSEYFYQAGRKLLPLFTWLNDRPEPLAFTFTTGQKEEFLRYFSDLKQTLIDTFGAEISGSVNRFGVQFVRIAMVLSALRAANENLNFQPLICTGQDFQNTVRIMEVFIAHQTKIFSRLEQTDLQSLPENKQQFIESLPATFSTAEAVQVGHSLSLAERTVKYWLADRKLFAHLKTGQYSKK